jgi:hypothetical protein
MDRISDHITYKEATKSLDAIRFGIVNTPDQRQLGNMKRVAQHSFEPCRAELGHLPIYVSSFFRAPALNIKIGGSRNSFHCHGMAMDLDADVFQHHTNKQIFDYFYYTGNFTELVWEYGTEEEPAWVHVAYAANDSRKMIKRATDSGIITFDLY